MNQLCFVFSLIGDPWHASYLSNRSSGTRRLWSQITIVFSLTKFRYFWDDDFPKIRNSSNFQSPGTILLRRSLSPSLLQHSWQRSGVPFRFGRSSSLLSSSRSPSSSSAGLAMFLPSCSFFSSSTLSEGQSWQFVWLFIVRGGDHQNSLSFLHPFQKVSMIMKTSWMYKQNICEWASMPTLGSLVFKCLFCSLFTSIVADDSFHFKWINLFMIYYLFAVSSPQ